MASFAFSAQALLPCVSSGQAFDSSSALSASNAPVIKGRKKAPRGQALGVPEPAGSPLPCLRPKVSRLGHSCQALSLPDLGAAQDSSGESAAAVASKAAVLQDSMVSALGAVAEPEPGGLAALVGETGQMPEASPRGVEEEASLAARPPVQASWAALAADTAVDIASDIILLPGPDSPQFSPGLDLSSALPGAIPLTTSSSGLLELPPTPPLSPLVMGADLGSPPSPFPVVLMDFDPASVVDAGAMIPLDASFAAEHAIRQTIDTAEAFNAADSMLLVESMDGPLQKLDEVNHYSDVISETILPEIALSAVAEPDLGVREDVAEELVACPPEGIEAIPAVTDEIRESLNRALRASGDDTALITLTTLPSGMENLPSLRWARRVWERSGAGPRIANIMGFAGPALGIWLCSPLMSLIDTAVVGSSSSLELAALGPGTIVVDNLSFLYMFLSTAAANLIATSMAEQKPKEASRHLQRLLFVAAVCGVAMLAFSELCATSLISGLAKGNPGIVEAASRYAKIRGLAWPAVLVASVTQSASLALQDSWSPLICLGVASAINLFGDIFLCRVLNMGIAGAAWATAVSQYAACALMVVMLARGRKLKLGVSVPSFKELFHFMSLAGPIFITLVAKVGFYTLVTYMATKLGTVSLAAHQVVIGIFAVCAVCAEPLSQTAQAFLPRLCVGAKRDLGEAKALIRTLGVVAVVLGAVEGLMAAAISKSMPFVFTSDAAVAGMMGAVVTPMALSLLLNPVVLASEGVLLANRDVGFLATAMMGNLAVCGGLLLLAGRTHMGLLANWWIVVLFQVGRIAQAGSRICSPHGILAKAEHAA